MAVADAGDGEEGGMAKLDSELVSSTMSIRRSISHTVTRVSTVHMQSLVDRLEKDIDGKGAAAWDARRLLQSMIVVLYPVVKALRALGFAYAMSVSRFSPMTSQMASDLCVATISLSALFSKYGVVGAMRACRPRSLLCMSFPGIVGASGAAFKNLALLYISPDLVVVITQLDILVLVPVQYILLRRHQTLPQMLALVGTFATATAYSITRAGLADGSGSQANLLGPCFALASAVIGGCHGTAIEFVATWRKRSACNVDAEGDWLLVAHEFWNFVGNCLFTVFADGGNILRYGVLYGWGWATVVGAVLPAAGQKLIQFLCVIWFDSAIRALAGCLDVIAVYPLQILILRTMSFDVTNSLLLTGLACSALNFTAIARELKAERLRYLAQIRRELLQAKVRGEGSSCKPDDRPAAGDRGGGGAGRRVQKQDADPEFMPVSCVRGEKSAGRPQAVPHPQCGRDIFPAYWCCGPFTLFG